MAEFVMPSLGADMRSGKLIAWRKKPGEKVERGEILADVDTDKATIEVESFASGVLETILVEPGQEVPVGTVLAVIREDVTATQPKGPAFAEATARGAAGRLKVSPAAAKLAEELKVDLASVAGTGPGGRITREDVEKASRPARAEDRDARMRLAIASAMARSKREIPHYYLATTIDLSRALEWLSEENQRRPVSERLLYGVLLIKAVALALHDVPELNGFYRDGTFTPSQAVHVGVAISLRQGGLIAPALHDADRVSLLELMKSFRDLVSRARAGTLRGSELSDPTITVTSLGERGVESVFGVIYPPQVALVGFGRTVERPWVVEGRILPRSVLTVSLSADHRVSDGHRGGLFLSAVDSLLQEPGRL